MADQDLDSLVKKLIDALNQSKTKKQQQESQGTSSAERSELYSLESVKSIKDAEKAQEKILELLKEQNKNYTDIDEKIKILKQNSASIVDDQQILTELQQERLESLKNEFQINQKALLQTLQKLEEIEKLQRKLTEEEEEKKKFLEAQKNALIEITRQQAREIENLEKQEKLKESILSIAKEIKEQAIQYTFELEKHIMNISKLNGGYAEYGSKLREANIQIYQATAGSGIMFEEANAAFAEISKNFIGLTTQSQQSIKTMAVGAAQLTKIGVDAGAAAKGFDSLVNSMGKTPQQAYKIQESFVQMAAKNRLALGAVSQAFAENSSRFVGYGEQMTKVLDGLAEQSLKTGVAINSLVKIAQQFDTFEGAAKAVGNLNALLGGDYFNSIELLTASDDERIKLLKEGVTASGMQWESMNRFQKMAVANAAGISDLNEASKIFGKTSLENTKQQEDAAKVQKTLAEQAESVSTSMDKMKSVINGVIIALDPFVSILGSIVEFMVAPAKWGKDIEGFGGKVITVFGSLISLTMILAAKNLLLGKSFGGIGSAIGGAVKKLWEWVAGKRAANEIANPITTPGPTVSATGSTSSPVSNATSGFLANAGNMLKAAGAILLFAAALYVLAKALQEFSSDKINGQGIALAATSIIVLLGVFKAIDKATGQIGKGSLGIGIMAIALIALGVGLSFFKGLDWKILAGIGAIILGLGLAMAGFGMAVSGPQALLIGIGIAMIVAIAGALLILGSSLEKISTSFKTLSELKNIGELSSNLISFLDDLADTSVSPINDLANAIGLLAENLQKLASISANMNIKGNVEATTTQNIQTLANQAGETAISVGQSATTKSQQSLIPAQQTTAFVPLIVQINGKNIIDVLRKDIEIISGEETRRMLESVGIAQSADYMQYSPVVIEGP